MVQHYLHSFGFQSLFIYIERNVFSLDPNNIGDFLAGFFTTAAFIWIIATALMQLSELREHREQFEGLAQSEDVKIRLSKIEYTQKYTSLIEEHIHRINNIATIDFKQNIYHYTFDILSEKSRFVRGNLNATELPTNKYAFYISYDDCNGSGFDEKSSKIFFEFIGLCFHEKFYISCSKSLFFQIPENEMVEDVFVIELNAPKELYDNGVSGHTKIIITSEYTKESAFEIFSNEIYALYKQIENIQKFCAENEIDVFYSAEMMTDEARFLVEFGIEIEKRFNISSVSRPRRPKGEYTLIGSA